MRMTLAYTTVSPHFLLLHLWSSNYSRYMGQQCHMEAMASSYHQCQSSNSVRNVFIIPTALHIASGNNIEEVSFDLQTKMRSHLMQCFEKKTLSPFPQTRKKVKRSLLANILIPVYCQYGRPHSLNEMIQCDGCDAWFHFQCAHIKRAPDSNWFCSNCTK